MIQVKCIEKIRDYNNKIYGYKLIDINGQTQDVTPEDLKRAIQNNHINVINLTLTIDGRLIDKKPETQLQNKKIMTNKVEKPTACKKQDRLISITKSICDKVDSQLYYYDFDTIDYVTTSTSGNIDITDNIEIDICMHIGSNMIKMSIMENNAIDNTFLCKHAKTFNGDILNTPVDVMVEFVNNYITYIYKIYT